MSSIINKKIVLIISLIIAITFLLTNTCFGLYTTGDFAKDFSKYSSSEPKSLLGKTFPADRYFGESNVICIGGPDGTGAGPYNSRHRLVGIIDMNYNEPNTAIIYKEGNKPIELNKAKNYDEIKWFNALSKVVAESKGNVQNNKYGAAFSKITSQNLSSRFKYILGTSVVPSVGWLTSAEWNNYTKECEQHGKYVLDNAIDDSFKASDNYNADEASCETVNVTDEDVYIGPFKYNYKSKVSFGSIEITGKNDNDVVYTEKITKVDKSRLFVKDGSKYKGVDSVDSETAFYVKVNKKIDEAGSIEVKVTAKDVSYYKSRIAVLKSQGVPSQNLVVWWGEGQPKTAGKSIEFKFENNKGNLEVHKSGIYTDEKVEKVENMGFKIYYLEKNKKHYLKLTTVDNNFTGDITIKKQEDTTNSNDATIVYTDNNGDVYLRKISTKYQYYLEEIADKTDYTTNILTATQILSKDGAKQENAKNDEKGIIGPIVVEKASKSKETKVEVEDARKTGNIKIVKEDYDIAGQKLSGIKFKVQNTDTKKWVKAEGKNGVYNLKTYENDYSKSKEYYKDNYTSNEQEATEFETNANGEITINGVDIGNYTLREVYIGNENGTKNDGYTEKDKPSEVDENYIYWSTDNGKTKDKLVDKSINIKVEDSNKTAYSTIYIYNKKKFIKITGKVWEENGSGKSNDYEFYGSDVYKEGDKLIDGITVRLKNQNNEIIKSTETKNGGQYEFTDISREAVEKGEYFVEFEYNGLTYTSVLTLVGEDNSINSKAGEIVEKREELNKSFTEITNKGDISERDQGYSRNSNNDNNVTGELTYNNDIEKHKSTFNNASYEGVNVTANTNTSNNPNKKEIYTLQNGLKEAEKALKEGKAQSDESGALVIPNVDLGLIRRNQPHLSVANDIESAQIDVNTYSHIYEYNERKSFIDDQDEEKSAFNVNVKFNDKYIKGYTRYVYPSDIEYSKTGTTEDTNKLKVYVTYAITIRNLSNELKSTVNEVVNYYDKQYSIVDSWINDNKEEHVEWNNSSKYGQKYDDGKYVGSYTTSLAGKKLKPMETAVVHIKFKVSDDAIKALLGDKATLNNISEVYSYSTYYGKDKEGCKEDSIYAGIDEVSAPGNAKPGDNSTYESDTDEAPSLTLEARGARIISGHVFEDKKDGNTGLGDGKYANGENSVNGVKVELLKQDGTTVATIYPPVSDQANSKPEEVTTAQEGKNAETTTGKNGYYEFRGVEPDAYYIRYTYTNGETEIFDTNGNKIKDVTVQNYKSTIITSDTIKNAFESESNLAWYKDNNGGNSVARDDWTQRTDIDNELKELSGTSTFTKTSLEAYTPKFKLNIEPGTIQTISKGDSFEYNEANMDFGIIERPKITAQLDKTIKHIKLTLSNGQVLIDGDVDLKNNKVPEGITFVNNQLIITVDNELIYGSHLEIDYVLALTNTSEQDYIGKEFYYYGIKEGAEPVKITGATLIDYVDSHMELKAGDQTWEVAKLVEDGFNLSDEEYEKLNKQFSTIVKAKKLDTNIQLAPGQSEKADITVEKLLSTNDSELTFENNGEITKISKNGGASVTTKLGSFAATLKDTLLATPLEEDEVKSATVQILPPTGSTDNSVNYAIIAAISLAVIGAGTYGVRRFLKK